MKKFADVILPLPLPRCFTYSLPEEWADEVQIGCRVVVPFGRKKFYTAIVRNVHYFKPEEYEVKDVLALLDARPVLLSEQFSFGSGWPTITSARRETFIKPPCPPG